MRKLILSLQLCLSLLGAAAQTFTVTGRVTDRQSGQPLVGASVFCQNTTVGTTTGADGQFRLTLAAGGYDLVASYSGYETSLIRINTSTPESGPMDLRLALKDRSLEEVTVVATNEVKDGWEKYGSLFREQFLGRTVNSDSCRIENPEALRFLYSRKRDRLKVLGREPLRIVNRALGYSIRYELDSLTHEFASGNTEYIGYALFEDLTGTQEEIAAWKENRERAYYGSMLHFMRCYYDSTLGLNGYRLERVDPLTDKLKAVNNPYDTAYYQLAEDGDVMLISNGRLRIAYAQERPEERYLKAKGLSAMNTIQISLLEFPDTLTILENGYFYDQRETLALGYWSWEKLADLLPYTYDIE